MKHFSIWCICMSPAGVVFCSNVVVAATDIQNAIDKGVDHLLKNGTQVTLMPGSPPVPCSVASAVVQRADEIGNKIIEVVQEIPKEGVIQ